jgi:Domain of unknown function (DUF4394)
MNHEANAKSLDRRDGDERCPGGALAARRPTACAASDQRANTDGPSVFAVVTDGSRLIFIDFLGAPVDRVPVAGLMPGETLIKIDSFSIFGVQIGDFIALGSMGTVYVLEESEDGNSFKAVKLGQVPPTFFTPRCGFDVDPLNKIINATAKTNESVLLDQRSGFLSDISNPFKYIAGDANFGKPPDIAALAYSIRQVAGQTTIALFGIDMAANTLVKIDDPLRAMVSTVGLLGVKAQVAELDIQLPADPPMLAGETRTDAAALTETAKAFALLTLEGETLPGVYEIDLQTGHATRRFSLTEPARGFTLLPGSQALPADTEKPQVSNVVVADGLPKLKRNKTVTVTWQATDNTAVDRQFVELSLDNGETFAALSDVLAGEARTFQWRVDAGLPNSKKALIRVRAVDAAGNQGAATSERFKIK